MRWLFGAWPEHWGPLHLVFLAVTIFFTLFWWYQFAVSVPGFWSPKRLRRAAPRTRFAIVVPAHDEERVLGQLLDSLAAQDYPRDRFDVYVSCDNCTDRTAEVASARGARALVREDTQRRGKTWNVRWALEQIPLDDYDAMVLFDADNLVAADFLSSMNDYLEAHPDAEVVQGYLDTKNPDDSWISRATALGFWYMNRFWQHARMGWGLSAMLGGTGEVFRVPCVRRIGWDLESLTEDLEFSARLIVRGGRVHWNDWARVYDEKPLSYAASRRQRDRWIRGHYWVLWKYGPASLGLFLRTGRVVYLDLFLHLLLPARLAVTYFMTLAGMAFLIGDAVVRGAGDWRAVFLSPWTSWLVIGIPLAALHVVAGPSFRLGRLTFRYLPDLFIYFWFSLTWFPITVAQAFRIRDQGTWETTEHTRALALGDVAHHRDGGAVPRS